MKFTTFDYSFCEKQLWIIEYLNSFSALFICVIGLCGLINKENSLYIKNVYFALLLNGICSFGFQWTNHNGWGLLERFTMILIANAALQFENDIIWKRAWLMFLIQPFVVAFMLAACIYDDTFNILF